MEGQTTARKGPERRWLPPPETRRSGRRSPPLTTPEALTTTSTRGGRGALPVRPATRKGRKTRSREWRGGRGRSRPTSTQRARKCKVTRDLRGTMHLGDYLRVKQSRSKLSRRLARMKSEPAAAVRAWRDKAAETEDRAE